MFTGIVEEIGLVERISAGSGGGKSLSIKSSFDPESIKLGDSIAVNGVCLTVVKHDGGRFSVDAGPETVALTTTGGLAAGQRVNLERAMAVGDRIGGHLVQGHVDGVGRIRKVTQRENAYDIDIEADSSLLGLVAPRGSITVDGISLTVTGVSPKGFSISIIPHTWQVTTLGQKKVSDPVNLEMDVIARYVDRILAARGLSTASKPGLTEAQLRAKGF